MLFEKHSSGFFSQPLVALGIRVGFCHVLPVFALSHVATLEGANKALLCIFSWKLSVFAPPFSAKRSRIVTFDRFGGLGKNVRDRSRTYGKIEGFLLKYP